MLWAQAEIIDKLQNNWIGIAVGAGALFAVIVLLKMAAGGKKKFPDLEKALRENLAAYPPPPAIGPRRLNVDHLSARVRLVVVSPTGAAHDPISPNEVPELLDDVIRGLGEVVRNDKPRLKIWPTQLSSKGFAPTFHRLVASPDTGVKELSRWIKLAGLARAGQRPILLGLALLADQPCKLGELRVEQKDWKDLLRVE